MAELDEEMGGFAILPDHDEAMDGVCIDPDFFGAKKDSKYYQSGKTLVHLVGKYLGLKPLWGDMNCNDDGIEDTPIHNAPNTRCYTSGHISLCSGYPEEMVGNFMDSNPDDCATFFTKGQVARMHACLGEYGYRANLLKSAKQCDKGLQDESLTSRSAVSVLDFELIPNPASNSVLIAYANPENKATIKIEIYSHTKQLMHKQEIPMLGEQRGNTTVDITTWPQGSYYVSIHNGLTVKTKTLVSIK